MRKAILFAIFLLSGFTLPAVAQATEECDTAGLLTSIIEAASAATEADIWDVLTDIGAQISRMKAVCDGLVFEGTRAEVIGPVEFPEGIYRASVTTPGFFIAAVIPLEGECGGGTRMSENVLNVGRDEAVQGAEAVFTSTGCEALIEISNLSDPIYTLSFEKIR